jgi:monoamine oxidase
MASKNKSQDTKKEEGPKIVIIGSGPCGLGAAYRCQELGHENFVVLEAGSEAGGLSITATDENGFLWDMGTCICQILNSNIHTQHNAKNHTLIEQQRERERGV